MTSENKGNLTCVLHSMCTGHKFVILNTLFSEIVTVLSCRCALMGILFREVGILISVEAERSDPHSFVFKFRV